eukprot:8601316-Prorocentrum_lima.AAC.1
MRKRASRSCAAGTSKRQSTPSELTSPVQPGRNRPFWSGSLRQREASFRTGSETDRPSGCKASSSESTAQLQ